MAAVRVVLPWSTWPIVPTLTWGLVRANFSFPIFNSLKEQCPWIGLMFAVRHGIPCHGQLGVRNRRQVFNQLGTEQNPSQLRTEQKLLRNLLVCPTKSFRFDLTHKVFLLCP